jgi:hypothetical protein
MLVTESGISIDGSEVHPRNALLPMLVTEFGITTDLSEVHSKNAPLMLVTELGMTACPKPFGLKRHPADDGETLSNALITTPTIAKHRSRSAQSCLQRPALACVPLTPIVATPPTHEAAEPFGPFPFIFFALGCIFWLQVVKEVRSTLASSSVPPSTPGTGPPPQDGG